jgi:predicted transcriptional regulator YdeE
VDHDITFEEDEPRWLLFRDPDQNKIGIWLINPIDVQFDVPVWFREPMRDLIRFHLESKGELHLVVKSITNQNEIIAATTALLTECKAHGLLAQGDAIRISKFSTQVDAFYVGVPVAKAPTRNLPDSLEYIVIPKQEYTVYPIHKSKLETSMTVELTNRVQHSKEGLSRPAQFYIIEHSIDNDYIEAYIPYVWNDSKND